jgi:hypothetical protein
MVTIKPQLAEQIDHFMQAGYLLLGKNQGLAACQSWKKAWDLVRQILEAYPEASVEEINRAFHGQQSIDSWSVDFVAELLNAGMKDPGYYQFCVDFCQEYLARTEASGKLNNLHKQKAIGESFFRLGQKEEGDARFTEITQHYPHWGWGWISWANQYSFYKREAWYDLDKAEQILRQGLAATTGEDRSEISKRLREILTAQGRPAAASLF